MTDIAESRWWNKLRPRQEITFALNISPDRFTQRIPSLKDYLANDVSFGRGWLYVVRVKEGVDDTVNLKVLITFLGVLDFVRAYVEVGVFADDETPNIRVVSRLGNGLYIILISMILAGGIVLSTQSSQFYRIVSIFVVGVNFVMFVIGSYDYSRALRKSIVTYLETISNKAVRSI